MTEPALKKRPEKKNRLPGQSKEKDETAGIPREGLQKLGGDGSLKGEMLTISNGSELQRAHLWKRGTRDLRWNEAN